LAEALRKAVLVPQFLHLVLAQAFILILAVSELTDTVAVAVALGMLLLLVAQ
jgi:hypothetical protein